MTKIVRNKITTEKIEIPKGYEVCPSCEGRGLISLYDRGFKTIVHDPEYSAKKECIRCKGKGYIPINAT